MLRCAAHRFGACMPVVMAYTCINLGENYMDTHFIDDLAQRLANALPPGLHSLRQDIEHNFNAVLRARLDKLDLVTRDEFDAQTRVLARSRAKLEELERKIAELEQRLS